MKTKISRVKSPEGLGWFIELWGESQSLND